MKRLIKQFWLAGLLTVAVLGLGGCDQLVDPVPAQYTLTFDSHDGSAVEPITQDEGTAVAKPTDPAKTDYTFLGWFDAAEGGTLYTWPHTLTADITLHAQWQTLLPQYTITFNSGEGGSPVEPIRANEGTGAAKPADPVKGGHDFQGWFDAAEGGSLYTWPHTLTGDVTMYARWQARVHTLTFDSNGGSEIPPITENEGTAVTKPEDPTKDGYTFLGWFDAAEGGSLYTWPHALSAGITMYAHWRAGEEPEPEQYTIAFESEGGSAVAAITADAGTTVNQPANPEKGGFSFKGWYDAASGGTAYTWPHTLTANVTMRAQWTPQYTLTFDSNGGSPVAVITADAETPVAKPVNDPAKTGHTFSGWHDSAEGGNPVQWPHTLTADVTVYARWTPRYTLAFDSHGGSAVAAVTADAGTTVIQPPDPEKGGFNFKGWYDAASGGTACAWPHTLNADVTIHAQWTAATPLNWTKAAQVPAQMPAEIQTVCYGKGVFVAGSRENDGRIAWSDDGGATWHGLDGAATTFGTNFAHVRFLDSKFWAVGGGGHMACSEDGKTWTAVTNPGIALNIVDIAYGAGVLVAGGDRGTMSYSTDGGATWTANDQTAYFTAGGSVADFKALIFAAGKFLAVGQFAKTIYSSDGITWTNVSDTVKIDIIQHYNNWPSRSGHLGLSVAAYGAGVYVIGGQGVLGISADLEHWERIDMEPFGFTRGHSFGWINSLIYADGLFVLGGGDGKAAYSLDGRTWTPVDTNAIFHNFHFINGLAYDGNGGFVAVGATCAADPCLNDPKSIVPSHHIGDVGCVAYIKP
jgi:uncharacterized repeat protein (TIGR02543 family)